MTAGPGTAELSDLERMEVQRRPLTPREAATVVAEIRTSPVITGYSMAEWTGRRDVFCLVDRVDDEVVGVVLVHHLWGGWSEIAVVYVMQGHRGRGYGKRLLQATLRTLESDGRPKVIFFSDDRMEHLVGLCGFEKDPRRVARLIPRHFLDLTYKVQWLASAYRLRERRRKRRELGSSYDFRIGVLTS